MRRREPGSRQPTRVELDGGRVILYCGDCADVAADLPPVHAVVTDPPYGLGEPPEIAQCLTDWVATGEHIPKASGGFMGEDWDSFVPGPKTWRAIVRRLYPGGHLVAFAGTRTADLMGVALRLAGLEVRDMVGWIQGQGFPKSMDLSKAVDKRRGAVRAKVRTPMGATGNKYAAGLGDTRPWMQEAAATGYHEHAGKEPATEAARKVQGQGSSLKPSIEPAWICRRPIVGTLADTVERYGTGGLNIDAARIGVADWSAHKGRAPNAIYGGGKGTNCTPSHPSDLGRWPPNVAFAHLPGCVREGTRTVKASAPASGPTLTGESTSTSRGRFDAIEATAHHGDADGNEACATWRCEEGCPVASLAAQSVTRGPAKARATRWRRGGGFGDVGAAKGDSVPNAPGHPDAGDATRFFPSYLPDAEQAFAYVPKASTSERRAGVDSAVMHPTVKPVALMRWLVRLVTPAGGRVLDPFMGSGTTGIAAVLEGRPFIGIERKPAYFEVARARIEHAIALRDKASGHD